MGKKAKKTGAGSGDGVSENQRRATTLVENFCKKMGITLTSKYAQLKQLTSQGGSPSVKITMWGENQSGQKGLAMMDISGTGGKFCTEAQLASDYSSMHTIKF